MTFALVFPGQGSQSVGMMAAYGDSSVVRSTFDEASATLDQDLWHGGGLQLLLQHLADRAILFESLAEVLLVGVPLGTPVLIDCDAESDRISFLAHNGITLRRRRRRG